MKKTITTLFVASLIAVAGCEQEQTTSQSSGETTTTPTETETVKAPTLPEDFFLAESPQDAKTLAEARASAKTGDDITFTGYIGGRAEPFTDGRALFVVADSEKAPACGEECAVAWDACCVPGETIAANSATVQVSGADGKILPVSLNGTNGLAPGATVTVVGKVKEANEGVFIIDATGVRVGG